MLYFCKRDTLKCYYWLKEATHFPKPDVEARVTIHIHFSSLLFETP